MGLPELRSHGDGKHAIPDDAALPRGRTAGQASTSGAEDAALPPQQQSAQNRFSVPPILKPLLGACHAPFAGLFIPIVLSGYRTIVWLERRQETGAVV